MFQYVFNENEIADDADLSLDDLDDQLLTLEFNILFEFLLSTTDNGLSKFLQFSTNGSGVRTSSDDIAKEGLLFFLQLTGYANQLLRYLFRNSYDQYVVLGPRLSFGFYDVAPIGLVVIILLYHTTFKKVRTVVKRILQKEPHRNIVRTHRIIFFHLLLLTVVLFVDSIFASVVIFIGSIAILLVPMTAFHIGIISSFVCGIAALQITVC